ncbi:DUF481 domain-containing protein [Endomicrobium proavitum]|uniref:DUF3078 domain-containing protein n=1 Tax=Endomicrobium proavitum TaxID=1408281 RepID=A0A0G3WK69_9BACT|nr:DUF481 domain-containing protein [Endomicrobium proavitum]AKL98295.1 exported protein of unknown function [Endomicrobium proavitum]
MRKLIIGILLFTAATAARAQSSATWKTSGIFTWGYNQTDVSRNWTGKETFVRSWQLGLTLTAERISEKTNWTTSFQEKYGESQAAGIHSILTDMIEFNTVWSYKFYEYLQPYASFYLLTQNDVFWDPITYMESAGLSFTVFDNKLHTLKTRAGAAARQVDNSLMGNQRETGAEAVANYTLQYLKVLKFTSEARVFETFAHGENLQWQNRLFLKTGPWFTTELGYIVYFDNSRIPAHSWPNDVETMFYASLGLSFNLF